jgi:hypothetical protein
MKLVDRIPSVMISILPCLPILDSRRIR